MKKLLLTRTHTLDLKTKSPDTGNSFRKIQSYRLFTLVILFALFLIPYLSYGQLPPATQIASQMGAGWNLGNTLEAIPGETAWGNPQASQQLINSVKAAGFNTVRLPVAWDTHANQSTGVIDPAWMNRVQQVVDYCMNNDLYVVLNIHWDGGWLEENVNTSSQAAVNAKQQNYWNQIATRFRNYDEHLLFASANEPHADNASEMSVLLSYHQTFVNTVRATGGNNSSRTLIIQGPSTDIEKTNQLMNTLPTDQIANRMMVEVHYYTPYQYCLMTEDASWGNMFYFWGNGYHSSTLPSRNATWGEEADLNNLFGMMQSKFVNNGVPVIIGEFLAIKRTNLSGSDLALHLASREYFHQYVTNAAISRGMIPIYWDTGDAGSGLFNRNNASVMDQTTIDALTPGSTGGGSGNGNDQIWLEAECGSVGSLWQTSSSSSASNGQYVAIQSGNNSTGSAPGNSSGHINYTFSVNTSGNYNLWARVIAPTGSDDSFWIRMDGGSWLNWNNIAPGSTSWTWDDVTSYSLSAGSHTLTIAYREDGTQLDKLYLSGSGSPSGAGNSATNCSGGGGPSSSVYQLQNRATGLFLDGMGRTTNGEDCGQYGNTSHPNSKWEFVDVGNGYAQLRNVGTGLLLDGMGRSSNGSNVGQWANTTSQNSHWSVQQFDGSYYRLQNRASGLYLDGMGRSSNGSACGQWANTTSQNAQWQLISTSARTTVSIEELVDHNRVNVYPNPSEDGVFTISLPDEDSSIIHILDIEGKVVYQHQISAPYLTLKSDLEPGIYFINIKTNAMETVKKLIIK